MAGEDEKYLVWLRQQGCCITPRGEPCNMVPVQAHHRTGHGMGQKNHDHEAMPLCWLHHHRLHDLSGPFAGWTGDQLQAWQWERIRYYRGIYTNEEAF